MKFMVLKVMFWSVVCILYGSVGGLFGFFRFKIRSLNLGEEVVRDMRFYGWWMSLDEVKIGIVCK